MFWLWLPHRFFEDLAFLNLLKSWIPFKKMIYILYHRFLKILLPFCDNMETLSLAKADIV